MARPIKKGFFTQKMLPSYQVLGDTLEHGNCQELARRSGHSPQSWARWTREPVDRSDFSGSGRHNFIDMVSIYAQFIRDRDGDVTAAHPVARWLAAVFGGFFVPNPRVDVSPDSKMLGVAGDVLRETGETIEELRKGFEDGEISEREARRIIKEAEEAQAALEGVKMFAQAQSSKDEK